MCVREVAVLGKRVYEGLACDVVVPLCGGTCDKMLSCGLHRFHERCHRRHCIETCRIVVIKLCQCGEMKIEICGKRLQCENHKCPDPCQRGACAPCTIMFTISCACGDAHFELPVINLICHTNSIQGLYSLSMPSLEKGDAMSRGFKQHIAKQALIPKIYLKTILDLNFFLGILLAKAQVVDQELHLCKSKDLEEKVPATKNHVPKHQNQRERLQEQRRPHKSGRCCHYEVAFSNSHPCGDSGGSSIFWLQRSHVLSDWMDEVEEQQDRTMNLIIVNVVT